MCVNVHMKECMYAYIYVCIYIVHVSAIEEICLSIRALQLKSKSFERVIQLTIIFKELFISFCMYIRELH